jgi:hypothetical protein
MSMGTHCSLERLYLWWAEVNADGLPYSCIEGDIEIDSLVISYGNRPDCGEIWSVERNGERICGVVFVLKFDIFSSGKLHIKYTVVV